MLDELAANALGGPVLPHPQPPHVGRAPAVHDHSDRPDHLPIHLGDPGHFLALRLGPSHDRQRLLAAVIRYPLPVQKPMRLEPGHYRPILRPRGADDRWVRTVPGIPRLDSLPVGYIMFQHGHSDAFDSSVTP